MPRTLIFALICAFLIPLACALGPQVSPSPAAPASTPAPSASLAPVETAALPRPHSGVERNVTYCSADDIALQADIYFSQASGGKSPLLIFLHGGGWTGGSKDGGMGFEGLPALTAAGYTLASVEYRLAPRYKMPAMIEDAKCAVRSFRAHAAEYGIDPDRIGVIGASAGGQLAAMLGTADSSAGFDAGEYAGNSSRVQAVVDLAGPSDFRVPFTTGTDYRGLAMQVFGTDDPNDPLFAVASPVTWVSPDDPPFLILHGERDESVPLSQSQELYDALKAAGVDAELVVVKNAGHAMDSPDQSPTREELARKIVEFMQEKLQ